MAPGQNTIFQGDTLLRDIALVHEGAADPSLMRAERSITHAPVTDDHRWSARSS